MKVIGHRGAAGLALEHTEASIAAARKAKVAAIELDVRLTKDKQLLVCHDEDLERVSGRNIRVRSRDLASLKRVKLLDGQRPLSLKDVLKLRKNTPLIIELKDAKSAKLLLDVVAKEKRLSVASKRYEEVRIVHEARPDIDIYLIAGPHALAVIKKAEFYDAQGVAVNMWFINLVTYWKAKRRRLEIFIYTPNHPLVVWWLHLWYPKAAICTDRPDRYHKPTGRSR